jgi:hypothetical protein
LAIKRKDAETKIHVEGPETGNKAQSSIVRGEEIQF